MKSILFFSASIGLGHDLAVLALIEEIKCRYPHCRTKIVDTFKYINPVLNKVIVDSYFESLKFNPKIWGYLYKQAEEGDKFVDLSHILSKLALVKMERLIKEFNPQALVCTHAFPAGILSILKAKGNCKIPLIVVVTAYTIHPFWIHNHVDQYILPCEELKYQFMVYNVPESKLMFSGIPLRRQFAERINNKKARYELGLEDKTTVLVMGGGLGLGEIESIISILGNDVLDLQVISVTGRNERLRNKLQSVEAKNRVKVFGYIENMAKVMAASDFIITKPGGLTTAEVLAQGLPMIIVDPLPGQEDRNTEFLLNCGVAVKVRNVRYLIPQLKYLISNHVRFKQIKEMAAQLAKPHAAAELVDYLAENINSIR